MPEPPQPETDTQAARLRSYETLIDVSRMLLGSASLEELFDRVTTELRRLVGYDAVTIYGVDEVRGLVVPLHSVDMWADEIMGSPLRIGEGLQAGRSSTARPRTCRRRTPTPGSRWCRERPPTSASRW